MSIFDTFTSLARLPQERFLACCEVALDEPHESLQLAAVQMLVERGARCLDLIVDRYVALLPMARAEVQRHADLFLKVARERIIEGRDEKRLFAYQLVAAVAGLPGAELLVLGLADPIAEVRSTALSALLAHARTLAATMRRDRESGGVREKTREQAMTWQAFAAVLRQFGTHRDPTCFDVVAEFGAAAMPLVTGIVLTQRDSELAGAFEKWLRSTKAPGSVAILLGMIADKSPLMQRTASYVLREHREDGLLGAFADGFTAMPEERQQAFLRVFGEMTFVQLVLPVIALVQAATARRVFDMLLSQALSPVAMQAQLERFLAHPEAPVQVAALRQLRSMRCPGGVAAIATMLTLGTPAACLLAAQMLAEIDVPNKGALFTPLLASPDAELRRLAMREVAKVSFGRYMQRFDAMAPKARQVAARAVAKIDDQMLDRLGEEVESLDPTRRLKAVQVIEFLDAADRLQEPLLELLGDPDPRVRATVVRIVALSRSVEGIKILLAALAAPDTRVRANAIEAFEQIDDASYVQLLTPFLRDPDNRVRANAAKALWSLGWSGAREALLDMLEDDDESMRMSAAWALGEVGCATAREVLEQRSNVERSDRVRVKINEALAALAAPSEGVS